MKTEMIASTRLRAGSETGSLFNHIYSGQTKRPEVGDGATRLLWTDRLAGTIVEVSPDQKRVVFQEDTATRTDDNGMSDAQSYEYAPDPEAPREVYTFRPRIAAFIREGEPTRTGSRITIGVRRTYYDFSF